MLTQNQLLFIAKARNLYSLLLKGLEGEIQALRKLIITPALKATNERHSEQLPAETHILTRYQMLNELVNLFTAIIRKTALRAKHAKANPLRLSQHILVYATSYMNSADNFFLALDLAKEFCVFFDTEDEAGSEKMFVASTTIKTLHDFAINHPQSRKIDQYLIEQIHQYEKKIKKQINNAGDFYFAIKLIEIAKQLGESLFDKNISQELLYKLNSYYEKMENIITRNQQFQKAVVSYSDVYCIASRYQFPTEEIKRKIEHYLNLELNHTVGGIKVTKKLAEALNRILLMDGLKILVAQKVSVCIIRPDLFLRSHISQDNKSEYLTSIISQITKNNDQKEKAQSKKKPPPEIQTIFNLLIKWIDRTFQCNFLSAKHEIDAVGMTIQLSTFVEIINELLATKNIAFSLDERGQVSSQQFSPKYTCFFSDQLRLLDTEPAKTKARTSGQANESRGGKLSNDSGFQNPLPSFTKEFRPIPGHKT